MSNTIKETMSPIIGVIGGLGPYAGLDLIQKIFINTLAAKDQDHLNCILISCPSIIPDRSSFLLQDGSEAENPALGMFESARRLYTAGARYAAVACNTAHSSRIFTPFCAMAQESLPELTIVNMLETCVSHVKKSPNSTIRRIGLLASKGTYKSRVYHEYFRSDEQFELMEPEAKGQEKIHEAIYNERYGIKAHSRTIKPQAQDTIISEIYRFIDRGAEAVILGCTELPLAVQQENVTIQLIDPGLIAARKLIALAAPEKLLN